VQKQPQQTAQQTTESVKQYDATSKTNNKNTGGAISNKSGLPTFDVEVESVEERKQTEKKTTGASNTVSPRGNVVKESPPAAFSIVEQGKMWVAMFDYTGGYRQDQELVFKKDSIVVSTNTQEGWLFGHIQGEPAMEGWFPSNYVKPL